MERVDCVVVGAGVVGLAVARALAQAGREVLLLEAQGAIGTGTSARNSEVIHAGIYYRPGSRKARWCVQGRALLYAYCCAHGIAHRACGKLIVATSPQQLPQLQALQQQSLANGVQDVAWLSAAEAQALEPALQCCAALHSPSTGIIDSHGLMQQLLADMEHAGGSVVLHTLVQSLQVTPEGLRVQTADGTTLLAQVVVNAAGLQAPALAAATQGLARVHVPTAYVAKGNYFALSGRSPFQRLIYPIPEAAGLGVHLTLDLAGQAKFGPDVQWVDDPTQLQVDAARGQRFYAQVRQYWPGLADGALQPAYAGMRPKVVGPGQPDADFILQDAAVHGVPGLVNLLGIESPGLTSCLALAQEVLECLREKA